MGSCSTQNKHLFYHTARALGCQFGSRFGEHAKESGQALTTLRSETRVQKTNACLEQP